MSQMLGNQYFLARDYARATYIFEKELQKYPKHKRMRYKIIICYTQIGEIKKALDVFISLVEDDIEFIMRTDAIADDCPSLDLVFKMEKNLSLNSRSLNFMLTLAMLCLYCDLEKSINYFSAAQQLDSENTMITYVLSLLRGYKKVRK